MCVRELAQGSRRVCPRSFAPLIHRGNSDQLSPSHFPFFFSWRGRQLNRTVDSIVCPLGLARSSLAVLAVRQWVQRSRDGKGARASVTSGGGKGRMRMGLAAGLGRVWKKDARARTKEDSFRSRLVPRRKGVVVSNKAVIITSWHGGRRDNWERQMSYPIPLAWPLVPAAR